MNYKGHFWAGFWAGLIALIIGIKIKVIPFELDFFSDLVENPSKIIKFKKAFFVLGITWFFSLFPDLDTSSLPQRWFSRFLLVLLIAIFLLKRLDLFIFISFLIFTFLIHKHRGWTHWKITPWILCLAFSLIHQFFKTKDSFFSFSWEQVFLSLKNNWFLVLAAVFGHYVHLFLDSRKLRKFSFLLKKFYR